jgi:transcriptional regulator with PAS, ATPase and Fis domain
MNIPEPESLWKAHPISGKLSGMGKARNNKSFLTKAIQQSPLPVYILTADLKIGFANQATCDWLGMEESSLIGISCVYHSPGDDSQASKIASSLCPPPDALEGIAEFAVCWRDEKGDSNFRKAIAVGIGDSGKSALMVVVHGAAQTELPPVSPEIPERRLLHAEIARLQFSDSQEGLSRVVGKSSASARIRRQVALAVQSSACVLVSGPRGSGREKIARMIHFANGPEAAGPLVPFDCQVGDLESLETILRHLVREYQQAGNQPPPRLLLKEIQSLDPASTRELLTRMQQTDFRLPLAATVIAAQRDKVDPQLDALLSTIVIEIPPLDRRPDDIGILAQALLEQGNGRSGPAYAGFENDAMECLARYAWPGELDELTRVVDEMRAAATPPVLRLGDVPSYIRIAVRDRVSTLPVAEETINLDGFLADIEAELIHRAVEHARGNKSHAARLLGISRARLLRRLGESESGETSIDFVPEPDGKEEQ